MPEILVLEVAWVYLVDIDQGIHKEKMKVALNEKGKKLHGFSFSINMANSEAFCQTKKLISNLFFLKSDGIVTNIVSIIINTEKNVSKQTVYV